MIPDLSSIEARLREREAAIMSGQLGEAELRALAEEGIQILRELRRIRAEIAPVLCQAEALLRQLEAATNEPMAKLDCRF